MREVITFGEGRALSAVTYLFGKPGIVLCNAPDQGEPGEPAVHHSDHMKEYGTVILFSSEKAARRLIERIEEAIQTMVVRS